MKFNSQVCTTKEQSERLLALGLKKETADMGIVKSTNEIYVGCPTDYSFENSLHIPAWSLHRLIEMMPYDFIYNNNTYELQITCNGAGYDDREDRYPIVGWWRSNTYDDIIDCIEWLIKAGYFNKEYLEGKDETI